MKTDILNQLGLTNSEVKVYFALFELESSTVGPLSEKAKVQDSKIYSILEKLKEKGLVSFVIKNNVKHFQASSPQNLIRLLNEKEEHILEQKKELENTILPQIEAKRKLKEEKQEATVYEGYEGIKSAFNVILETVKRGEEYQVFTFGEGLKEKRVIHFFQWYHKRRMEKGLKIRLITERKFKGLIDEFHRYKGMQFRFTTQKIPIGTYIFKSHVMTIIWGEKPTAFIIKSKANYDHYKAFFEDSWKKALQ